MIESRLCKINCTLFFRLELSVKSLLKGSISVKVFPMTPEERSLLERTHKLAEENNKILHSLRRANRFATLMTVCYWVIIIGVSFGAYYVIQPYIEMIFTLYGKIQGDAATTHSAISSLQGLLK